MRVRRLSWSSQAETDFDAALDTYLAEAGPIVAYRFSEVVDSALQRVLDHPELGTDPHARFIRDERLRGVSLKGFPYSIFYLVEAETIEIVRVLHERRDIPQHLR